MFGISGGELLVILFLGLLLFGPQKIPQIAKIVAKILNDLKKSTDQIKKDIMENEHLKQIQNNTYDIKNQIEKSIYKEEKEPFINEKEYLKPKGEKFMRKKIIIGNWKMNKNIEESLKLVEELNQELKNENEIDIVICPPFTSLLEVKKKLENSFIELGAQNLFWEETGAYTGEISPVMLKDIGCKYVIIGHSERRMYFNETNEMVNKKIKAALKKDIIPIMCVGENLEQRKNNETFFVIEKQLEQGLLGIELEDLEKIIIAYEPIWAIGTGVVATIEQAQEVHSFIREKLSKIANSFIAEIIRIQYGGSVTPENIQNLITQKDIDGALVGGASLKSTSFISIIKNTKTTF
ncbi:MAG: triose-phosphate isomerase [bacterium]